MSKNREERVKDFLASYKALCIRHGMHLVAEEEDFRGVRIPVLRVGLLDEKDVNYLTEIDRSGYWL